MIGPLNSIFSELALSIWLFLCDDASLTYIADYYYGFTTSFLSNMIFCINLDLINLAPERFLLDNLPETALFTGVDTPSGFLNFAVEFNMELFEVSIFNICGSKLDW